MESNSVCNHTRDQQIRLPLRACPILLITRMITDRIGLHTVLLLFMNKVKRIPSVRDTTVIIELKKILRVPVEVT